MPRRPRWFLPDLPLHVIQRGNNRAPCFFADEDYQFYLHWLHINAEKYGCAIHAYVLMTNHVHLLVTPKTKEGVSRLMQSLGRRYVQYINRFYKRSGTMWEGRFKACVVDAEAYLLHLYRYIELNPVRAGMVTDPADYRWSSYRHNGLGQVNKLINEHPLYQSLDRDQAKRQAAYRQLFRSELDQEAVDDIRKAANRGQPLGGERFRETIEAAMGLKASLARGRPKAGGGKSVIGEQLGFEI